MNSIISNDRRCYVCGSTINLHRHHIFEGTANRKKSEKYGCWVYLCDRHHNTTSDGVHFNKELDLRLKRIAQQRFGECYQDNFAKIFRRNYI